MLSGLRPPSPGEAPSGQGWAASGLLPERRKPVLCSQLPHLTCPTCRWPRWPRLNLSRGGVCAPCPPGAAGSLWVQSAFPEVGLGPSSLGQVNVASRMDGQLCRVSAWPPQPRPYLQAPAPKPAVCQAAGHLPTSPNHGPHTGCRRFPHSEGRPGCLGRRGDRRVSPGLGCTPQAGPLS